ncbi:MAG: thiamine phosphate synthase [Thermomicrobiales bacterium]|nr:thiamine phosphate synthase [Thermomicrobiales bacterium]
MTDRLPLIPRLMWVTDRHRQAHPTIDIAAGVTHAGVDAIHVREKDLSSSELRALVESIQAVAGDCLVIVNGDVTIAQQCGAGLHLAESAPLDGSEPSGIPLLGRSVHSPESAAASEAFDYVIAGHVFATGSKSGSRPLGLDGLAAIVREAPGPALAIGGITPENTATVLATGAHGVAVMTGIGSASDPVSVARQYRDAIDQFLANDTTGTEQP